MIPKRPLHRAIWSVPGLYSGRYIEADDVHVWRASALRVEVLDDRPALLDIDGESPGQAPARFTILPGAIRLLDLQVRPLTLSRVLPDDGVMAR